jgi:hypothetical protein
MQEVESGCQGVEGSNGTNHEGRSGGRGWSIDMEQAPLYFKSDRPSSLTGSCPMTDGLGHFRKSIGEKLCKGIFWVIIAETKKQKITWIDKQYDNYQISATKQKNIIIFSASTCNKFRRILGL